MCERDGVACASVSACDHARMYPCVSPEYSMCVAWQFAGCCGVPAAVCADACASVGGDPRDVSAAAAAGSIDAVANLTSLTQLWLFDNHLTGACAGGCV